MQAGPSFPQIWSLMLLFHNDRYCKLLPDLANGMQIIKWLYDTVCLPTKTSSPWQIRQQRWLHAPELYHSAKWSKCHEFSWDMSGLISLTIWSKSNLPKKQNPTFERGSCNPAKSWHHQVSIRVSRLNSPTFPSLYVNLCEPRDWKVQHSKTKTGRRLGQYNECTLNCSVFNDWKDYLLVNLYYSKFIGCQLDPVREPKSQRFRVLPPVQSPGALSSRSDKLFPPI